MQEIFTHVRSGWRLMDAMCAVVRSGGPGVTTGTFQPPGEQNYTDN